MLSKKWFGVLAVLAGMAGLVPAMAGPVAIGSLVASTNATLDGQAPLPNTTMLSGDSVQVRNGLVMVTLKQGNRMLLGRETEASFPRDAEGVTVSLARGKVSFYQPESSPGLQVKVGDITVLPAQGFKTLGEVAVLDGLVVVTAKSGTLQVERAGNKEEVRAGKTITIPSTPARAPNPNPPGNRHMKRIWGVNELLVVGAVGADVAAAALILANHGSTQASPSTP